MHFWVSIKKHNEGDIFLKKKKLTKYELVLLSRMVVELVASDCVNYQTICFTDNFNFFFESRLVIITQVLNF